MRAAGIPGGEEAAPAGQQDRGGSTGPARVPRVARIDPGDEAVMTQADHAASCACTLCSAPAPRDGAVPFDGLDHEGMPTNLAQAERRAILGMLPRRSMWPEMDQHDQRLAALRTRQSDVENRLRGLLEQRVDAPAADAQAAA